MIELGTDAFDKGIFRRGFGAGVDFLSWWASAERSGRRRVGGRSALGSLPGGRASDGGVRRRRVLGRSAVRNGEVMGDSGGQGGCGLRMARPSTIRSRLCSCSSSLVKRTSERVLLLGGSTNRGDRGGCVCDWLRGVLGGLVGDGAVVLIIGKVVEERSLGLSRP